MPWFAFSPRLHCLAEHLTAPLLCSSIALAVLEHRTSACIFTVLVHCMSHIWLRPRLGLRLFTVLALSYQTLGYALASVCVFTVLALSYQTPGYALAALDVTFAMFGHLPSSCILATLVLTYLSAPSLCSILLCLAGANGTLICGFALFAC